jgi:hypothetical protein
MGLFTCPSHLQLFLNLGSDIYSDLWNEWDLTQLSRSELQQLGIFLGMTRGYSFPKSEVVTRILGLRQIWLKIRKLGPNPSLHVFLDSFPRYALAGMMRGVGIPSKQIKATTRRKLGFLARRQFAFLSKRIPGPRSHSSRMDGVFRSRVSREAGPCVIHGGLAMTFCARLFPYG